MRIGSVFLSGCFLLFASAALADEEVYKAPRPDWVKDIPVVSYTKDRSGEIQFGISYLLVDRQVRKTDNGFEYARRLSYEVVDRTGLEEAARIMTTFDPSEEVLSFNFIRIHRDGEVIDQLADTEITVFRQEEGLDNSLLDGDMTALIQLEDVRVGDRIDYSFSGVIESRLWPEEYFDTISVEWSVPLAQVYYSLSVPADLDLTVESIATDETLEVSEQDGQRLYTLNVIDPDPIRMEGLCPQ